MNKYNIKLEPIINEKYQEIFNTEWLPKLTKMISGSDWTEKYRKKKYTCFLQDSELSAESHNSIISFMVFVDNSPVGYVQSYDAYGPSWKTPLDNLPKSLTTFEICVWDEEYLAKGISDQILHLLLSEDILGDRNLLLITDTENIEAIKLLSSCDFKIVSTNSKTGEVRMVRLASQPSTQDTIEIVPYNPLWPELAEDEIEILKNILKAQKLIDIQHIGSTSVPSLSSKPIIDIYIAVESISNTQSFINALEKLEYQFIKESSNLEHIFFVKGLPPYGKRRTHHLHIVKHNSHYWNEVILFRDYLRTHHIERENYQKLKLELAAKYTNDREAYTDAKTEFVKSILKKAATK